MSFSKDSKTYALPSMRDVEAAPWNGYNVVSTFSGCGGSCLGYRMAGYRVKYALEFIEEAQRTYKANHPTSFLDCRDVRTVKPEEILEIIGMKAGEIDLFDGSPPCSAFSTAGSREGGWGKVKQYSDKKQRVDDLFFEYIRLLKGLQPKVFVAENVSGLIKGSAKGYFLEILAAMKACGYEVSCRLLDAQWLGVPQMRQRTIFVGVRNDLKIAPCHPTPFTHRFSLADALKLAKGYPIDPDCDISRFAIGALWDTIKEGEAHEKRFSLVKPFLNKPCNTVVATCGNTSAGSIVHPYEKRKFSVIELKAICSFPLDFVLTGDYPRKVERLGRSVPPLMMKAISETILKNILEKTL